MKLLLQLLLFYLLFSFNELCRYWNTVAKIPAYYHVLKVSLDYSELSWKLPLAKYFFT